MNNRKAIAMIAGALILVAVVFLLVLWFAGTPKNAQPPANMAPSTN